MHKIGLGIVLSLWLVGTGGVMWKLNPIPASNNHLHHHSSINSSAFKE